MTMPPLVRNFLAGLPIALLAAGCLNLKPVPDHTRYFILQPKAEPMNAEETRDGLSLGVAPVRLPEYLEPAWLAVRTGDTEIRYAEFNKWGEPLDRGVQRVLANNLAALLSTERIRLGAWKSADVDVELHLALQRFEADERGEVTLEARWQLRDRNAGTGHKVIQKQGPAPGTDPAKSVETMSAALADLARAIAVDINSACKVVE
jgi:uncharacterized lipoprotein YmbA